MGRGSMAPLKVVPTVARRRAGCVGTSFSFKSSVLIEPSVCALILMDSRVRRSAMISME